MPSLKRQSDFQFLRNSGKFKHASSWLAVSFHKNSDEELRWGWTLPKKIGNAVLRNRLKRWGRDQIREFSDLGIDVNFVFKIKKREFYKSLTREEFNRAFRSAFSKIRKPH